MPRVLEETNLITEAITPEWLKYSSATPARGSGRKKHISKVGTTGANNGIGSAVAIRGDVAVLGAEGENSNAVEVNGNATNDKKRRSGAAWVYERIGRNWETGYYLKAPDADNNDSYGIQVSISGSIVIVAAYKEESSANVINGRQDLIDAFRADAISAKSTLLSSALSGLSCKCCRRN